MVRRTMLAMLLVLLTACGSQKMTPEQITQACTDGGTVAALAWVAEATPPADQIKAVEFVLDEITKAMAEYKGGKFSDMLPQIKDAINKAFPGADERSVALNKLATLFATRMLSSLDDLFAKHPDWEKQGVAVSGYVGAFTTGARKALKDFAAKAAAAPPTVAPTADKEVPKK